jgi:3-methyladenine DNA glycosylase Mpg
VSHFHKPTPKMNPCFLLGNPEQTPLAEGARVGIAHRRREEAWRLPVRPLEAILRGRMHRCVRQAPTQPSLGRGPERLHRAVHLQTGDLMVVANAGDSRVVLGTASDNGDVTLSSS